MTLSIAQEVLTLESNGILAVRDNLGPEFEQAVSLIMSCPSRLVITGIGKSGLVAQKIAATLNSTGTPSFFLHPVEAMHGDLGMLADTDVVIAISYSGETSELNRLLGSFKERKLLTIAMCGDRHSTLALHADVTLNIAIPKEACSLGLAPTTSTTATMALGDALAVTLMMKKQFKAEDFRRNHPGGSLGERLKVAVQEVMLTGNKMPAVTITATMRQAIDELNRKNLGAVFIIDSTGLLKGILTDGDLRRLVSTGSDINQLVVSEIMTPDPFSTESTVMAADALSLMQRYEITVLAVTNTQGALIGILHLHDLLGKGEFRFLI